jgi:hypothetical protein
MGDLREISVNEMIAEDDFLLNYFRRKRGFENAIFERYFFEELLKQLLKGMIQNLRAVFLICLQWRKLEELK